MERIPQYFNASTKKVVEEALKKGYLHYPSICFIQDIKIFAWLTKDNQIQYIQGDKQITDVRYENGYMTFYAGTEIVYSANISLDVDDAEVIIKKITETLHTSGYIKADDVIKIVEDKIGYINNKNTVVEYIDSLSYNKWADLPIINKEGTLTNAITVSELNNGIYKIKGQYIVGGDDLTVRNGAESSLTFIDRDNETDTVNITIVSGNKIEKYSIDKDGTKSYDKYVTESWIKDKNFITSTEAINYINTAINDSMTTLVDTKIDQAFEERIGMISIKEIQGLFKM